MNILREKLGWQVGHPLAKKAANVLKAENGHSSDELCNTVQRLSQRKIEAETWGVEGRKQARHLNDAGWSHERIHRRFESRVIDSSLSFYVGDGNGSGGGSSSNGEVNGGTSGGGDGGGFDFDIDFF